MSDIHECVIRYTFFIHHCSHVPFHGFMKGNPTVVQTKQIMWKVRVKTKNRTTCCVENQEQNRGDVTRLSFLGWQAKKPYSWAFIFYSLSVSSLLKCGCSSTLSRREIIIMYIKKLTVFCLLYNCKLSMQVIIDIQWSWAFIICYKK